MSAPTVPHATFPQKMHEHESLNRLSPQTRRGEAEKGNKVALEMLKKEQNPSHRIPRTPERDRFDIPEANRSGTKNPPAHSKLPAILCTSMPSFDSKGLSPQPQRRESINREERTEKERAASRPVIHSSVTPSIHVPGSPQGGVDPRRVKPLV